MLRRLLRFALTPLWRYVAVRMTVDDPWAVSPTFRFVMQPHRLGAGSTRPFSWYFEGTSDVPISNVDELTAWLAGCQYLGDPDLFHEADYWQHPRTFEQLRRGDCEDHALWAWRKLIELGLDARFFVGLWRTRPEHAGFHAWVVFEQDAEQYVLESVVKEPGSQLRRLGDVRDDYVPHYSVDRSFRIEARAGLLQYWRDEELARRARRKASASAA